MKKIGKLAAAAGVAAYGLYRWNYRMPLKDYTAYALYMGVMDDAICRRELKNSAVIFPPRVESLSYKYHLFLQMNRKKSRKKIQKEIWSMEQHLYDSYQTERDSTQK